MIFDKKGIMAVNKDWPGSIEENIQYRPWISRDIWKSVECQSINVKDNTIRERNLIYRTAEDNSVLITEETEPFQILKVEWLENYGRSNFGYCVRIKDTSEIVAMIQQEDMNAWDWCLMLKYETLSLSQSEKKDGWLSHKLLANTINQVFHYLIEEE